MSQDPIEGDIDEAETESELATPVDDPSGPTKGASIEYELDAWARESREMLRSLLLGDDIPHVWEGGRLVVPEVVEERVDAFIEQVELTTLPTLDPLVDQLAFTIEDLSQRQLDALCEKLDDADISFEFNLDGELVVEAPDGEVVDDLIDDVEFPDALPIDDGAEADSSRGPGAAAIADADDGQGDDAVSPDAKGNDESDESDDDDGLEDGIDIDPDEVLGGLFIAADRLARHPKDPDGVLAAADLAVTIDLAAMPYGYEKPIWKQLVASAGALRLLLASSDSSDDEVSEQAGALRDLLRDYV